MRKLLAICLFCVALGACSKGFDGDYKGEAKIDTFRLKDKTVKLEPAEIPSELKEVTAIITRDGAGGTIELYGYGLSDCKLKFDSLNEKQPKISPEQICYVGTNGYVKFTIYDVLLTYDDKPELPVISINVNGTYTNSYNYKQHLLLEFSGYRYQ